jgi:hypothetical protein
MTRKDIDWLLGPKGGAKDLGEIGLLGGLVGFVGFPCMLVFLIWVCAR